LARLWCDLNDRPEKDSIGCSRDNIAEKSYNYGFDSTYMNNKQDKENFDPFVFFL
jgi:hypothetical protein